MSGCWLGSLESEGQVHRSGPWLCPTMMLQSLMFLNTPSGVQSLECKHH